MTTTTAKADRFSNRAPKGGAVSPVNGRFHLGGQFMPMVATLVEAKPATLEGSTRQVAWANRLRREALAILDDEIHARLLFLAESKTTVEAKLYHRGVKPLLMTERSAARVIERREAPADGSGRTAHPVRPDGPDLENPTGERNHVQCSIERQLRRPADPLRGIHRRAAQALSAPAARRRRPD